MNGWEPFWLAIALPAGGQDNEMPAPNPRRLGQLPGFFQRLLFARGVPRLKLVAKDDDFGRGFDADSDPIAGNTDHSHNDVIAEADSLGFFAGQDEHGEFSVENDILSMNGVLYRLWRDCQ